MNNADKKQNLNITISENDNNKNFTLSKRNLNKLLLNKDNLKENIKNYIINKLEIYFISNRNKEKNESENEETNANGQKEQLINKKMKEINKEMVKLKEDSKKVGKIRVEYEKSLSKLNNDLYQFNQKKENFKNTHKMG